MHTVLHLPFVVLPPSMRLTTCLAAVQRQYLNEGNYHERASMRRDRRRSETTVVRSQVRMRQEIPHKCCLVVKLGAESLRCTPRHSPYVQCYTNHRLITHREWELDMCSAVIPCVEQHRSECCNSSFASWDCCIARRQWFSPNLVVA
jgi:hypothetical protein